MAMSRIELRKIARVQNLIGGAKGAYQNDRDKSRYEHVVHPLEAAFDLCVELTANYSPVMNEEIADGN
jgi:hypothetical protein